MDMADSTNRAPDSHLVDGTCKSTLTDVRHISSVQPQQTDVALQVDCVEDPESPAQMQEPKSINTSVLSASNLMVTGGTYNQTTKHHVIYQLNFPQLPRDAQVEVRTTSDQRSQAESQGFSMQHPDNLNTPPLTSTDTSTLALSQANIDLTPKSEPSNRIYERNMLKKGRGYPLWIPECSQTLHIKKRRLGVEVGDVGLIDKDGCFVFLFNILRPINHPFHPQEMPEGYSPVPPLRSHDLLQTNPFGHHTALTSVSVRREEANPAGSSALRSEQIFEMLSSEAVILTLPDGAQSSSVQTTSLWVTYMSSNLKSWYKYVKVTLGYEVNNGDIRLVTGCDKASYWGMAVAEQQPTAENGYKLRFRKVKNRKSPIKHVWECSGFVDTRVGPNHEHIREVRRTSVRQYIFGLLVRPRRPTLQRDQCLFVRSINTRLGSKSWDEVKAEAEGLYNNGSSSGSFIRPSLVSRDVTSTGSTVASQGKKSASGSESKNTLQDRFVTSSPTPVRRLYTDQHPADFLSKFLLFMHPKAKAAVVNDDDWCFALRNIPDFIPLDENEIICAVLLELCFECSDDNNRIVQAAHPHDMPEQPTRSVAEIAESLPGVTTELYGTDAVSGCLSIQDLIYVLNKVIHVLQTASDFRLRATTAEEHLSRQNVESAGGSDSPSLNSSCSCKGDVNFDPSGSSTMKAIFDKLGLVISSHSSRSSNPQYVLVCENFQNCFKSGVVPDLARLTLCASEFQRLGLPSASTVEPSPQELATSSSSNSLPHPPSVVVAAVNLGSSGQRFDHKTNGGLLDQVIAPKTVQNVTIELEDNKTPNLSTTGADKTKRSTFKFLPSRLQLPLYLGKKPSRTNRANLKSESSDWGPVEPSWTYRSHSATTAYSSADSAVILE